MSTKHLSPFITSLVLGFVLLGGSSIHAAATIDEGLGEMAASLGDQISKAKLSRIGGLEFINDTGLEPQLGGNTGSAGRYAATKLVEGLFKNGFGDFEVIERKELEKVIQEVKLKYEDTQAAIIDIRYDLSEAVLYF